MNGYQPSWVIRLLEQAEGGDQAAVDDLLPLVYQELKRVVQVQMNAERSDHTATALVHEANLRLVGAEPQLPWSGITPFYYSAGEAMQRILMEHARKRGRVKRGGSRRPIPLEVVDLASLNDSQEILSFDELQRCPPRLDFHRPPHHHHGRYPRPRHVRRQLSPPCIMREAA